MTVDGKQIVVRQPNETVRPDVRPENETVWLNRLQMAQLFGHSVKTNGKPVANARREELSGAQTPFVQSPPGGVARFAITTTVREPYQVEHYNLDVVLSVGYRLKSPQGILFRRWGSNVLEEYLLRGYSINARLNQLEDRIDRRLAKTEADVAVLKNLGRKCFAFTKLDASEISRIKKEAFVR